MTPDEILTRVRELWTLLRRETYVTNGKNRKYHALVRQIRQLTDAYRQAEREDTRMGDNKDDIDFDARDRKQKGDPHGLHGKVTAALKQSGKAEPASGDCTLCDDAQWWIDNGFTHAERVAFCNSIGCPVSPEGESAE